jgi:hypothetical protein
MLKASQFANNNFTDAPDANRRKSTLAPGNANWQAAGTSSGAPLSIAAPYAWFAQHPTWREASSREFDRCCRIL